MSCPHGEWHEEDCEICQQTRGMGDFEHEAYEEGFRAGCSQGKANMDKKNAANGMLQRRANIAEMALALIATTLAPDVDHALKLARESFSEPEATR